MLESPEAVEVVSLCLNYGYTLEEVSEMTPTQIQFLSAGLRKAMEAVKHKQ